VSDLYAMGFDPVSDRRNFTTARDPDFYNQQVEELHATETNGFVPALAAELDKLAWCETLILQFPLWWFGLPAILKGWVDRVFAMGRTYGGGRWYDNGVFRGRRAMCSVTTGAPGSIYEPDGLHGDIAQILFPINHGILYFTGFTVLDPFLAYGPGRASDADRAATLIRYRDAVRGLDSRPAIAYPPLAAYDASFRRKPAAAGD
jgi:NAD(P)H dehydrogenase (quinone)